MTALTWDSDPVSDGLERVVLFLPSQVGVPWNGLISVTPDEIGNSTTQYFDGRPFLVAAAAESYSASLIGFTYPDEFEQCETPPHTIFGLSYRETTDKGYLLHLVWGATAAPTDKSHSTRAAGVDLSLFTWDISTKTQYLEGTAPVSHLVIDPETTNPEVLLAMESAIYGLDGDSYLPSPMEVLEYFKDNPWVRITDLGDGTFTIEGPEHLVHQVDETTWDITSGGIMFVDADEYDIKSW